MSITQISFSLKTLPVLLFQYKFSILIFLKTDILHNTKILFQISFYFQNFGQYALYINSIQSIFQIITQNKSTYFI